MELGINEIIANILRNAFVNMDEQFFSEQPEVAQKCGATMVCCLIIGNRIFCANVGDSRAVLSRNGKAINLSFDHKTVTILWIIIYRQEWMSKSVLKQLVVK